MVKIERNAKLNKFKGQIFGMHGQESRKFY